MPVEISALIDAEEALGRILLGVLRGALKDRLDEAVAAAKAGKYDAAQEAVSRFTVTAAAESARGKVRLKVIQSLLLGASTLSEPGETAYDEGAPLPDIVDSATEVTLGFLTAGLKAIQAAASSVIAAAQRAAMDRQDQPAKADLDWSDAFPSYQGHHAVALMKVTVKTDLADALNQAVFTGQKVLADVGANLSTTRLVAYGFLAEAMERGFDRYQINEVLDSRICPVCREQHGKVFAVPNALERLDRILRISDPNELKQAAPWPKQDRDSVDKLGKMTKEEMQQRGWDTPPFHPRCRGVLVEVGTAPADPTKPNAPPPPPPLPPNTIDDEVFGYVHDQEKPLHDAYFADAPVAIKDAIRATERTHGVGFAEPGKAYYSPSERRVMMDPQDALGRKHATWRHEYGHHFDWRNGGISWSQDGASAMAKTAKDLSKRWGLDNAARRGELDTMAMKLRQEVDGSVAAEALKLQTAGKAFNDLELRRKAWRKQFSKEGLSFDEIDRLRKAGEFDHLSDGERIYSRLLVGWKEKDGHGFMRLFSGKGDPGGVGGAMDFFNAASANRFRYTFGHSDDYYQKWPIAAGIGPGKYLTQGHTVEAFANYFAARGAPDRFWEKAMRRFAPKLTKAYDEAISAVAAKGKPADAGAGLGAAGSTAFAPAG